MKGTLFKNGIECQISIDGEVWNQGTEVKGKLTLTNHGHEDLNASEFGLHLAMGTVKKVKASAADAFNIEQSLKFEDGVIAKGDTRELEWCFHLFENCHITENTKSYYIIFGRGDDNWEGAALQLKVVPQVAFQKFLEIIETFLRFKVKTIKTKKKGVEVKLMPPASEDFRAVDFCNLTFSAKEKDLTLAYSFAVNKMNYTAGNDGGGQSVKMQKEVVEFSQELTPQDYLFYGRDLDQDKILKVITENFEKVKSKPLI